MHSFVALVILLVLRTAYCQQKTGFGPYFSTGPTKSWIREATTTLVLPAVPSPQKDRLALWPGMGTSGQDLIQALAVSFSDPAANCKAGKGQWCIWASTLQGQQLSGKQVPAPPGAEVTINYKYNDSTKKYDQTVSVNGTVVSNLSTSSGFAQGFGTAVECQDSACRGTVAAHQYLSTTVILNATDLSYGKTLALNEADSSGYNTTDGGKTWKVATINIHSHTFNI